MSATFLLTESFKAKSLTWNSFLKYSDAIIILKRLLIKAFELLENKNNLRLSVSIRWMNFKLDVAIDLNWLYPESVLENKIINYKYNED